MADSVSKLSILLSANADNFAAGISKAEKIAQQFSASLQAQIDALDMGDDAAERYHMRLQGIDDATIKLISSQRQRLNAEEAQIAADREHNETMERGEKLENSLATAQERFNAKLNEARTLLGKGAIDTNTYWRAVAQLTDELHKSNSTYSFAQGVINQLKTPMQQYHDRVHQLQLALKQGTLSQKQFGLAMQEAGQVMQQQNLILNQATKGYGRGLYAVQQLAFGAQDAATVFGTMGFAGAVRAASNNIIQFGSLLHPGLGVALAAVGTAVALYVDHQAKAGDATERLNKLIEKQTERFHRLSANISKVGEHMGAMQAIQDIDSLPQAKSALKAADKRQEVLKAEAAEALKVRKSIEDRRAAQDNEMKNLRAQAKEIDDIVAAGGAMFNAPALIARRIALNAERDELKKERAEANKNFDENETRIKEIDRKQRDLAKERIEIEKKLAEELADFRIDQEHKLMKKFADLHKKGQQDIFDAQKEQYDLERRIMEDLAAKDKHKNKDSEFSKRITASYIEDDLRKRLDEIAGSGLDKGKKNLLSHLAITASQMGIEELADDTNKKHLAGAAEFGSKEAYSRVVENEAKGGKKIPDYLQSIIDKLEEMRKALDNPRDDGQIVDAPIDIRNVV